MNKCAVMIPGLCFYESICLMILFIPLVLFAGSDTIKIVCFGNSITAGGWTDVLQSKLDNWHQGKFLVINKGQSGNTTADGFDRLQRDIIPNMPAIVLIEFGINDSNYRPWAKVPRVGLNEFKKNLREFNRVIIANGGRPVFIVNHPILEPDLEKIDDPKRRQKAHQYWREQGNGKSYTENVQPYNEAIRHVVKQLRRPVIDLPKLLESHNIDPQTLLASDGVHLTEEGNEAYAEMVFQRLRDIATEQFTTQRVEKCVPTPEPVKRAQ